MSLVTIEDLSIGFRGPPLLDGASFRIEPGQKIGLLGRNGAGKTTLMRILSGQVEPDSGQVSVSPGIRIAQLPQDVPQCVGAVRQIVAEGAQIESHDDSDASWKADLQVEQILSRMKLDGDARYEILSSGMKRRVLLAKSLAGNPDLLLLDEPTNHLDIDAIEWLETFFSRWERTLLFVTHDRMFLRRLANRILEIDRGHLFDWSCDYDTFIRRKEAALAAEEQQDALFDRKLAEEEVWIRQGIKARRTRNEGRVRSLEAMRRKHQDRRSNVGKARLDIQVGERSGNMVAEAKDAAFAYEDHKVFSRFSTLIMRGDKVGIIGPNGAGKTTLVRVLLGQLAPTEGNVRLGTNLQVAYFDQLRAQLDEQKTVQENVADGYDTVNIGGKSRHVVGYLQDFLFTPERARTPVRFLSGGERNRLLLARLFGKPANIVVLDEPTNDLDSETLELLEERLVEFAGTILLVSHDRAFLNNVVTSTIVFEEDGVKEYEGGYDDWLRQRPDKSPLAAETQAGKSRKAARSSIANSNAAPGPGKSANDKSANDKSAKRRLSYREQQERMSLPETIEQLESRISTLHDKMAQPDFYARPGPEISQESSSLKELEDQLATAYERWEALEELTDEWVPRPPHPT